MSTKQSTEGKTANETTSKEAVEAYTRKLQEHAEALTVPEILTILRLKLKGSTYQDQATYAFGDFKQRPGGDKKWHKTSVEVVDLVLGIMRKCIFNVKTDDLCFDWLVSNRTMYEGFKEAFDRGFQQMHDIGIKERTSIDMMPNFPFRPDRKFDLVKETSKHHPKQQSEKSKYVKKPKSQKKKAKASPKKATGKRGRPKKDASPAKSKKKAKSSAKSSPIKKEVSLLPSPLTNADKKLLADIKDSFNTKPAAIKDKKIKKSAKTD